MKYMRFLILVGVSFSLVHGDDAQLNKMAEELVKKRSKVDEISMELDIRKAEIKTLQSKTEAQKLGLDRQIKDQESAMKSLDEGIADLENKLKTKEVPPEKIKPILMKSLDYMQQYIKEGIPFKKNERLAEIKTMRELISNGSLIPEKGLTKVWSMLESEFRLTRENGLYRQDIDMDGKTHSADIVKVGMTKMYFKINEEKLGEVVKKADDYEYIYAISNEDKEHLNVLFENFQKKIRSGYFVLPKT